jgi:hypothetical protein
LTASCCASDRSGTISVRSSTAQWDPAFYVYAGVLLAGSLGWLFIDSSRPIADAADQLGR